MLEMGLLKFLNEQDKHKHTSIITYSHLCASAHLGLSVDVARKHIALSQNSLHSNAVLISSMIFLGRTYFPLWVCHGLHAMREPSKMKEQQTIRWGKAGSGSKSHAPWRKVL